MLTCACVFAARTADLQRNLKGAYDSNWALKERNGQLERENRELKEKLQQGAPAGQRELKEEAG